MAWTFQNYEIKQDGTVYYAICHTQNAQMTRSNGIEFDHLPTDEEVLSALSVLTTQWDADDAAELAAKLALEGATV